MINYICEPFNQKEVDENVFYVGYIGIHNNEHHFKYGISHSLFDRDLKKHQKSFDNFQLVHVEKCNNNKTIEILFSSIMKDLCLKRKLQLKPGMKQQKEIFIINEQYDFNFVIDILKCLVKTYPCNSTKIINQLKMEQNQLIQIERLNLEKLKIEEEKLKIEKLKIENQYLRMMINKNKEDDYLEVINPYENNSI